MSQYKIEAQKERERVYAMLDDPAWWVDNEICLDARTVVEGDRVMSLWIDRYTTRVNVFRVTKVARKWRTIELIGDGYPKEDRFFFNEMTNRPQMDHGNGVGRVTNVYGHLNWEIERAEQKSNAVIEAAGLKFDYGHGRAWSPEKRIQLAAFLQELGMVPE